MTEEVQVRRPWIRVDGQPLGHVPAFDGIRGFFVVLVVLFHAYVINRLVPGGGVVIDMFFVFSGFLITTLLLDEHRATGNISLRKFYTRRVLRLFPAMYLLIAVFVGVMVLNQILHVLEFKEGYSWGLEAVGASLYSYHILWAFKPEMAGAISHTWSLSVEEQFYFLWPALFAFVIGITLRQQVKHQQRVEAAGAPVRRVRVGADRWLVIGAVGFVVAMVALRFSLQHMVTGSGLDMKFVDQDNPTWQGVVYRIAGSRPDMVVYGCLVAIGVRHVPRPVPDKWLARLRIGGIAAWILLWFTMIMSGRVWGFDAYGGPLYQLGMLSVGLITLDFFLRPQSAVARFFCARPLQSLGQRSYGIYLWHVPVLWIFLATLEAASWKKQVALGVPVTLLAIGAGYLSLRYVEKPFLKLKDRKYRRPADTPVTEVDLRTPTTPSAPADGTALADGTGAPQSVAATAPASPGDGAPEPEPGG